MEGILNEETGLCSRAESPSICRHINPTIGELQRYQLKQNHYGSRTYKFFQANRNWIINLMKDNAIGLQALDFVLKRAAVTATCLTALSNILEVRLQRML